MMHIFLICSWAQSIIMTLEKRNDPKSRGNETLGGLLCPTMTPARDVVKPCRLFGLVH